MDGAGLDRRHRPGRLDSFSESGEAIGACDDDIAYAPVGEFGADPTPELRTFSLLNPDPQDMANPLAVNTYGDVGCLVAERVSVLDLHDECVKEHHRVEGIQWPRLPREDLLSDRVGDVGDRLRRQVHPQRRDEVVLDIADRHPARVQADDHHARAHPSAGPPWAPAPG